MAVVASPAPPMIPSQLSAPGTAEDASSRAAAMRSQTPISPFPMVIGINLASKLITRRTSIALKPAARATPRKSAPRAMVASIAELRDARAWSASATGMVTNAMAMVFRSLTMPIADEPVPKKASRVTSPVTVRSAAAIANQPVSIIQASCRPSDTCQWSNAQRRSQGLRNFHDAGIAIDSDPLPVVQDRRGIAGCDDGRHTVLAGDDRRVREDPAAVGYQRAYAREEG